MAQATPLFFLFFVSVSVCLCLLSSVAFFPPSSGAETMCARVIGRDDGDLGCEVGTQGARWYEGERRGERVEGWREEKRETLSSPLRQVSSN